MWAAGGENYCVEARGQRLNLLFYLSLKRNLQNVELYYFGYIFFINGSELNTYSANQCCANKKREALQFSLAMPGELTNSLQ
jgi:hypothetical protein